MMKGGRSEQARDSLLEEPPPNSRHEIKRATVTTDARQALMS
jgi:hypothetical protein